MNPKNIAVLFPIRIDTANQLKLQNNNGIYYVDTTKPIKLPTELTQENYLDIIKILLSLNKYFSPIDLAKAFVNIIGIVIHLGIGVDEIRESLTKTEKLHSRLQKILEDLLELDYELADQLRVLLYKTQTADISFRQYPELLTLHIQFTENHTLNTLRKTQSDLTLRNSQNLQENIQTPKTLIAQAKQTISEIDLSLGSEVLFTDLQTLLGVLNEFKSLKQIDSANFTQEFGELKIQLQQLKEKLHRRSDADNISMIDNIFSKIK